MRNEMQISQTQDYRSSVRVSVHGCLATSIATTKKWFDAATGLGVNHTPAHGSGGTS